MSCPVCGKPTCPWWARRVASKGDAVMLRRWAATATPLRGVIDVYKCLRCGDTMAVNADAQTFRQPPPMECKACPGQPDMQPGRYYKVDTASSADDEGLATGREISLLMAWSPYAVVLIICALLVLVVR